MDYAKTRYMLISGMLLCVPLASAPAFAAEVSTDDAQTRESPRQDPGKLVDKPGEEAMMGYGTDGIADEVKDPSLGSRSMLGEPASGSLARFDEMDADSDGILTQTEAESIGTDRWQQIDANGNGEIDRSEFAAFEETSGSKTD